MKRQRVEFGLLFNVAHGATVFDQYGKDVGQVVGVRKADPKNDAPYVSRDGTPANTWFVVTADVLEEALDGKLQCMEPTIPVPL